MAVSNKNEGTGTDSYTINASDVSASVKNIDKDNISIYPTIITKSAKIIINSVYNTKVNINLLDINGRYIENIFSGQFSKGTNFVNWQANHNKGMYIIAIETDKETFFKKCILE